MARRAIVGFRQDAEGHWVATLACGHSQHMRHTPPLIERPWVVRPEGRAEHIGVEIACPPCPDRPPVRLRRALPSDLAILRHWGRQPHVMAATGSDEPVDWDFAEGLTDTVDQREWLIGETGGRPIGFQQIIDPAREATRYWGDIAPGHRAIDIWIGEPGDLGRGFGGQMMRLALARCFADSAVNAIVIDPLESNARAHRFYERLGFRSIGQRRFGDDDCRVYRLERAHWPPPA